MFNHPKGLYMLSTVEMWERFSYYGMRAIFSLFMVHALMFTVPFASNVYGIYTAFVYLTPLIGGYVSDRYLGNTKSIFFGGILMAIGQFLMAYSASMYNPTVTIATHSTLIWSLQENLMIIALIFLCLGCGFLKANISSMIAFLYEPNDSRLDSAFSIFYVGINLGALISPLVMGLICGGNPSLFQYGFLASGIGMCLGLVILMTFKNKFLFDVNGNAIGNEPTYLHQKNLSEDEIDELILRKYAHDDDIIKREKEKLDKLSLEQKKDILDGSLTREEKHRIIAILVISAFAIFFFSAFEQMGVSLTFFADTYISRSIGNFVVPTPWFQSVEPAFIIILAPLFAILWNKLHEKKKNFSIPLKISCGLFTLGLGFLIFAIPAHSINAGATSISMIWIIILFFLLTIAELFISPTGLSVVSKLSPPKFMSIMLGIWFAATALSNYLAGFLSGLYPDPKLPTPYLLGIIPINGFFEFFLLFAVFSFVGAVAALIFRKKIVALTHGVE